MYPSHQWVRGIHTPHRFFLTNSKTQSANTAQSLAMETVGMTGSISKWLLEKRAPKVLSSFHLQNASVSQTEDHQWEVILPFCDFSHDKSQDQTIKLNKSVTN